MSAHTSRRWSRRGNIADPAGRPIDEVRKIRDQVEEHVERLITERLDEIQADGSAHQWRLRKMLPTLVAEFDELRSPEEIRACADAILDRYDDVPGPLAHTFTGKPSGARLPAPRALRRARGRLSVGVDSKLRRSLLAEFLGSALLAAVVIGSGVAAQRLSPGDVGLELLENAAATAAGLYTIILMFGPVSGAHFKPGRVARRRQLRRALLAVGLRLRAGAGRRLRRRRGSRQRHVRDRRRQHLNQTPRVLRAPARRGCCDARAAAGDLLARAHQARARCPRGGRSYIGAAYFFTSSTSFANPAIAVGRMFSDHLRGHRPRVGAGLRAGRACRRNPRDHPAAHALPDVTAEDAAEVVIPHADGRAPLGTARGRISNG